MNREETLALYEQGVEAWNKWANEMLEERKRLEEAGEWEMAQDRFGYLKPKNKKTKAWFHESFADFSEMDTPYKFQDAVNFSNFIFPGKTNFRYALFNGKAKFNNATFYENAGFNDVTFNNEAWFQKTKFKGNAAFINTVFKKTANFFEATFHQPALFGNCKFGSVTAFGKTTFKNGALFSNSNFKGLSDFLLTKFEQEAHFDAISSESTFSLKNANFKNQLPDFIQANFKEAPRLDNIKIGDGVAPGSFKNSITTFIHPDIKARYQALKRLAVQAHNHEKEQEFWAGELRSDRSLKNEDDSWNWRPVFSAFWWGNIAYGFFSDYGRSIVRPLLSLFILLCIMTNIHIYAHHSQNKEPISTSRTKTHITKQSDLKDCDVRSSAFRVAAKNGAISLLQNPAKRSTFVRDYTCLYGTYNDNATPKIPNSIFWIELFHTLFSAILIFLTLLGIRNNFKLK